ncbi:hypothetical protein, partial [Lactimicrobium sp.]
CSLTLYTTHVYAQSGEGVNACTFAYNDLGFSSYSECERWLDYKAHSAQPKWVNKLYACTAYIAAGSVYEVKNSLMRPNIKVAVQKFGYALIGCMFL